VVLAAAAARTSRIRLTSATTLLWVADPVRVYEDFASLDLVSRGRAEVIVGRSAFVEPFALFGYDTADYDAPFAEKLGLLLDIRAREEVTWAGRFRPPLRKAAVVPGPSSNRCRSGSASAGRLTAPNAPGAWACRWWWATSAARWRLRG
jgi:alkanesulfonate monooxygenase SsuD/methylene tetrahydromethanopterin reductase-like flavin-dependent oxidoreductase (luciferase family)